MKAVLLLLFVGTVAKSLVLEGRGFAAKPAQRFSPALSPPLPVAAAAARGPAPNIIPIVRQAQDVGFDGTFQYSYETANGITVQEKGYLKNAGVKDQEAQAVEGSFSYPGPDGKLLTVRYYADETGFHAEGDHLPVPVKD